MGDRIPVAGPWITEREVRYAADAAENAWYERAGEYNRRFEEAFATCVGRRRAVSLPHCTSAIHLALAALGVGPGDEVVVPDVTWIASAAPIQYVGAIPVFADVDPATWGLAPDALEECITNRTRAVICVDLYGTMPDWEGVSSVADARGIPVIEDAAEAVGSAYFGRPAGSFGEASVFSFHGSKTLTTGEGGMLVADREELVERILSLRDHGRPPGDRAFQNTEVAFKYKMSALQAAVGLAQTERLDELVARKREIFAWYREALAGLPVTLNPEPEGTVSSYWMVTILQQGKRRLPSRDLMRALDPYGIDTRPFFRPLSSLKAYARHPEAEAARRRNRRAYDLAPYGLNLPSGFNVTPDVVDRVASALGKILAPQGA